MTGMLVLSTRTTTIVLFIVPSNLGNNLDMIAAPEVTLSNGIVIANFSETKIFTFIDGRELLGCSKMRHGILQPTDSVVDRRQIRVVSAVTGMTMYWWDINKTPQLTPLLTRELYSLQNAQRINIIFAPRELISLWLSSGRPQGKLRRPDYHADSEHALIDSFLL